MHKVVADYTGNADGNSNIKVYVRARPLEADNMETSDFIQFDPENERKLSIRDPEAGSSKRYGEVSFQFDEVFWTKSGQKDLFETISRPQIEAVMNGFNCCCFAYGQTGSGKTYSMFGEDGEVRGLIPRCVETLFQELSQRMTTCEVALVCSFSEIYNDQIRDLGKAYLVAMGVETSNSTALFEKTSDIFESLAGKRGNPYFGPAFYKTKLSSPPPAAAVAAQATSLRPGLKEVYDEYNVMNYEIREDTEGNVFVKDLSLIPVSTLDEVMALISMGLKVRATHETKMNATSSRSHTVFTITVLQKDKLTGTSISGMLNLVDLAGSERLKKSESQGVRLKETLHINTSLTALGKVIMALDPTTESSHVPYRDSKLTRILQNSLGGNSYTTVLATIYPRPTHYDECLSTLQFANRCRNVRNNPRVNYVSETEDKDRRIRQLVEEVTQLRQKLSQLEYGGGMGKSMSPTRMGSGIGGEGGNKQHAIAAKQQAKVLVMLKKLGVEATAGADGSILFNGKKVDVEDLLDLQEASVGSDLGGGSGVDDGGMGASGGAAGSGLAAGRSARIGGKVSVEKLQKQLAELQEHNASLQAKGKERKVAVDESSREIKDLQSQIVQLQTTVKHKEFEYRCLEEEKERALNEMKKQYESKHRQDLNEVMQTNKLLMTQQALQGSMGGAGTGAPATFHSYNAMMTKLADSKTMFSKSIREEFEKHLQAIERSRAVEIQHIHMQYTHWLAEKDRAIEEFVNKFNAYRAKKGEQLRLCEKEIITLYNYTEQMDKIVDGVEAGKYYVKQPQGRAGRSVTGLLNTAMTLRDATFQLPPSTASPSMTAGGGNNANGTLDPAYTEENYVMAGAVVLPKNIRPLNPLARPTDELELTKKIVERFRSRESKLSKVKEEAFQRTMSFASNIATQPGAAARMAVAKVDPLVEREIRNLLVPPQTAPTVGSGPRPRSSGASGGNSNGIRQFTPPMGAVEGVRLPSFNQQEPESHGMTYRPLTAVPEPPSHPSQPQRMSANSSLMEKSTNNNGAGNPQREEIARLQAELEALRLEKRLEDISLEKLTQEMASEDTINYIRSLEDERDSVKKQVKDLLYQLQSTKSANLALQRKMEAMASAQHYPTGKAPTGLRPSTSHHATTGKLLH